jgi:hypothetical protein
MWKGKNQVIRKKTDISPKRDRQIRDQKQLISSSNPKHLLSLTRNRWRRKAVMRKNPNSHRSIYQINNKRHQT